MKILAYLGNIAFIVFLIITAVTQDHLGGKMIMLLFIFLALPVVSLLALASPGNGKDFFSLYFERKRLEQEQQILAIKKNMGKEI